MSKKNEVPQELMDEIIECYAVKQYSLERTLKELKLPFGRNPLKRMLLEHGVHIRTFKEAANYGIRGPVPQEFSEQIVELYNNGYSIERIQKALTTYFSSDKIKSTLLESGIALRTTEEARECRVVLTEERKYPVNDDYPIESHNGAWLLGFVAADGYLPNTKGAKYRITIGLSRKDEDVLHLIAQELNYEGPIYQYLSQEQYECSSLSFTSKKLRAVFESYGIVNAKTYKLEHLPNLPKEYMIDFVRGFLDGDGWITESKDHKIVTGITCYSEQFLKEIRDFLHEEYGLRKVSINPDHNNHQIRYSVNDSFKLCEVMYNNDYLALPRKKKHYFEIKAKYGLPKEIITPTSLDTPQE